MFAVCLFVYVFVMFLLSFVRVLFVFFLGIFRNNKQDRMLICVIIPFIPWTLSYGLWDDGLRHIVLSIMMMFLALARLIYIVFKFLNRFMSQEENWILSKQLKWLVTVSLSLIAFTSIIYFNESNKNTIRSIIQNYKN